MKRIDYSPTSKKIFSEMNCLLYTSDICKYTGMWQKQKYYDEITSYGTTAYFEIGFTGDIIMLDADVRGDVKFLLDQKEVFPSYENLFVIRTEPSSHTLCVRIYNDSHITIRKMYITYCSIIF